ncbi:hypothetical protein GCM10010261_19720 [Streptomyces pilosus]|nr:hypothetical protein GCM10010261_19720 [Streptomyces pilosus]
MCGDVPSPHTGTAAVTAAAEANAKPVEATETKPRRASKAAGRAETVVEKTEARRGGLAGAARRESRTPSGPGEPNPVAPARCLLRAATGRAPSPAAMALHTRRRLVDVGRERAAVDRAAV